MPAEMVVAICSNNEPLVLSDGVLEQKNPLENELLVLSHHLKNNYFK